MNRGTLDGVGGQHHAPARERLGIHCTGGWVGLGTGLDRCGKSRPHRDWIPGPSSSQRVAILTTPSLLPIQHLYFSNTKMSDIGHTTPVIRVYHKTVVNIKVKPTLQDLVKNLLDPTFYLRINKSVVSEKLCCFVILDKSLK